MTIAVTENEKMDRKTMQNVLDWYKSSHIKGIYDADIVKVVRCKNCKMYRKDKELAEAKYCDPNYYCGLLQTEMDEEGYCSYGKRKND